MSIWSDIPLGPPDSIFKVSVAHDACTDPLKVNLGVGAYRDNEGKPYYFQCVREAENRNLNHPSSNKEYLPIDGLKTFREASIRLLLGESHPAINENRVSVVQSLSGTGALALGAHFLKRFMPNSMVYLPDPTWGNHNLIFNATGAKLGKYRWYRAENCSLDFEGAKTDLCNATEGSVILFHSCAHNPTGVDPTKEQWNEFAEICIKRKLVPFFDTAYQGFASGDLDEDAYSVRLFTQKGIEVLTAQSFAKNMGLYGERIGTFGVVCRDADTATRIQSQMKIIVRTLYSNPPMHGAKIVSLVLTDKELCRMWHEELSRVVQRIQRMRKVLYDTLIEIQCPGSWEHVTKQIGMFTYTGLDTEQSDRMLEKHHVFMLNTGRISVAGLNDGNVKRVAECIKEVVMWKMNGKKNM